MSVRAFLSLLLLLAEQARGERERDWKMPSAPGLLPPDCSSCGFLTNRPGGPALLPALFAGVARHEDIALARCGKQEENWGTLWQGQMCCFVGSGGAGFFLRKARAV